MYQLSLGEVGYMREPARRSYEKLYEVASPFFYDRRPSFHRPHPVHEPIPEQVPVAHQSPVTQQHHDPQPTTANISQRRRRRSTSSRTTQENTPVDAAGPSTTAFMGDYGADMQTNYFPQMEQQEPSGQYWDFTPHNQAFTDLLQTGQYQTGEPTFDYQPPNFTLTPIPFLKYESATSTYNDNIPGVTGSPVLDRPSFDLNVGAPDVAQLHALSDCDSYSQQEYGRGKRRVITRGCGTDGHLKFK